MNGYIDSHLYELILTVIECWPAKNEEKFRNEENSAILTRKESYLIAFVA